MHLRQMGRGRRWATTTRPHERPLLVLVRVFGGWPVARVAGPLTKRGCVSKTLLSTIQSLASCKGVVSSVSSLPPSGCVIFASAVGVTPASTSIRAIPGAAPSTPTLVATLKMHTISRGGLALFTYGLMFSSVSCCNRNLTDLPLPHLTVALSAAALVSTTPAPTNPAMVSTCYFCAAKSRASTPRLAPPHSSNPTRWISSSTVFKCPFPTATSIGTNPLVDSSGSALPRRSSTTVSTCPLATARYSSISP